MVEVAAAVMVNHQGAYFLQQRTKGDHAGKWELPGGKKEGNETLWACLARELREELGADVMVGKRLHIAKIEDKWEVHFFQVFLYGKLTPQEGQQVAWVFPDDIMRDDSPYDIIKEDLKLLLKHLVHEGTTADPGMPMVNP
jgi:8-oxo-dGTP diphosphatase